MANWRWSMRGLLGNAPDLPRSASLHIGPQPSALTGPGSPFGEPVETRSIDHRGVEPAGLRGHAGDEPSDRPGIEMDDVIELLGDPDVGAGPELVEDLRVVPQEVIAVEDP